MNSLIEWKCPSCGALLAADDMDVAADTVLCRSCGAECLISDLADERQHDGVSQKLPPLMPGTLKVRKTASGVELIYGKPRRQGLFFFGFGLALNGGFWAIFSALFTEARDKGKDISLWLMLPFALVGLAALGSGVYALFGRTTLMLRKGRGEVFRGIGPVGRRRSFTLEVKSRVLLKRCGSGRYGEALYGIVVEQADGGSVTFGREIMEEDVQKYLASACRRFRA